MSEIVLKGYVTSMARSHKIVPDPEKQFGGTWVEIQPAGDDAWRERHRLLVPIEEAKRFAVGQEIEIVFRASEGTGPQTAEAAIDRAAAAIAFVHEKLAPHLSLDHCFAAVRQRYLADAKERP